VNVQTLAILVPATATIVTTGIGAVVTVSGRKREKKVGEIYQAFEERGMLLKTKSERIEELQQQIKDCHDQLGEKDKEIERLKKQLRKTNKRKRDG